MYKRILTLLLILPLFSCLAADTPYDHLKELEWMIGDFADADPDVDIQVSNKWDTNKNIIYGTFAVVTGKDSVLTGTQVFAYDPITQKIRSWIFDSDGGFGEGRWDKKDKSYVVETIQTLANGSMASSVNIYTPIDANSYTWESTSREIGGQLLPDVEPIKIVRKKGAL